MKKKNRPLSAHYQLGLKGEKLALEYLVANGFSIISQNWRFEKCEVDLIAENPEWLVFVEVKTRQSSGFGGPSASVNERKQKQLLMAAEAYGELNDCTKPLRFDILSIIIGANGKVEIEHLKDAFTY